MCVVESNKAKQNRSGHDFGMLQRYSIQPACKSVPFQVNGTRRGSYFEAKHVVWPGTGY